MSALAIINVTLMQRVQILWDHTIVHVLLDTMGPVVHATVRYIRILRGFY